MAQKHSRGDPTFEQEEEHSGEDSTFEQEEEHSGGDSTFEQEEEHSDEDMSFEQKVALSVEVENLPTNEQPNIYKIVFQSQPEAIEEIAEDPLSVYLLFHVMRLETLRLVQSYILERQEGLDQEMEVSCSKDDCPSPPPASSSTAESSPPSTSATASSSTPSTSAAASSSTPSTSAAGNCSPSTSAAGNCTPSTSREKIPSNEGAEETSEAAANENIKTRLRKVPSPSIKARLRKPSRKSSDGSSK